MKKIGQLLLKCNAYDAYHNTEIINAKTLISKTDEVQSLVLQWNKSVNEMQASLEIYARENLKSKLEYSCKALYLEHKSLTEWIDVMLTDLKNIEIPKFEDFSQPEKRCFNDYPTIFEEINLKFRKCTTEWQDKRIKLVSSIENTESLCREFENGEDKRIKINNLSLLEPQICNFYKEDEVQNKINDLYREIAEELALFDVLWKYFEQIDQIMKILVEKNKELDEMLSLETINTSCEDLLLRLESLVKEEIDELHQVLNRINFPMSESEKTAAILKILRPVKQEFAKLQAKIKNVTEKIELSKIKKKSESEMMELKSVYESNLHLIKNSTNTLQYDDICWPCSGTVDEIIDVLLYGVEKDATKKAIRGHQRFWHPDKFQQLLSTRLHADDKQKILEKVNQISVGLNARLN